jgi:hypothetical protein
MEHATVPRAALLALSCASALAACAIAPRTSPPAKEVAAMPTNATQPDKLQRDQMSALKQGIDDIDASDFSDVQSLDRYLSTDLSAQQREEPSNPRLLLRSSDAGRFAGMNVRRVELTAKKGADPSSGRLIISLAEPGPEAETFASTYWPDAEYSPSRPHASGSPSSWTIKRGNRTISIYHPYDDGRIVSIGFSHGP